MRRCDECKCTRKSEPDIIIAFVVMMVQLVLERHRRIYEISLVLYTHKADAWSLLTALLLLSCVRGSGGGARYARSLAVG